MAINWEKASAQAKKIGSTMRETRGTVQREPSPVSTSPVLAPLLKRDGGAEKATAAPVARGSSYLTGGAATHAPSYGAGVQARELKELDIKPREKKTSTEPQKAQAPAWQGLMDLSAAELEQRHEKAKAERDALSDRVEREKTQVAESTYAAVAGRYKAKETNPIPGVAAASGAWVSEEDKRLAPLRMDVSRKQDEVNDLAAAYYHRKNQEQFAKLETDSGAKAKFRSAQELTTDLDTISKALSAPTAYNGQDTRFKGDGEAMKQKYGVDDLQALQRTLTAQKAQMVKELEAKGYDFETMAGYDLMLRQQENYIKRQEQTQKDAEEHPVSASGLSVILKPLQPADFFRTSLNSVGHSNADDLGSYVPANVYDMYTTNMVQTIRGTVSKKIEENTDWEIFGQNVGSFLYNTGMSMADSALMVTALGPGSTYLMGLSAAAEKSKEIIEQGGSNSQAFWGGLTAGVAEYVFEKFSVDNLLAEKSVTGWKSFIKETLKQGGIEASEEMLTECANIISDAMVMGERSGLSTAIKEYQEQGMTEDKAVLQACLDSIGQVAVAGAGGFISGVGMGAGKLGIEQGSQAIYDRITQRGGETAHLDVQQADGARFDAQTGVDTPTAQNAVEGLETTSTAIDADPATHTPEQMATIKEYQGAVDKGILSFVDRWRGLKDPNYRKKVRMDIAQVDQRTVQDIKAAIGVDISDFTGHSLSGNALEHIDLRHGAEGEADHSMADPNDIARMGYVLEHYDSVEPLMDRHGKPVLSGEYYNADGSHAPQVRFQKRVDGTYYVVEAVPDAATREFRVVSAYMQKGSDSTGQELTYHTSDPQLTSKTHLDAHTIASESSIPQTAQDVNPDGGDGMENSVGAAARGFTTPDAPRETKVSRQADTTMAYDDLRGAAAAMTKAEWNESFRYEVQSREQWEQWASEHLFVEREGERAFIREFDPAGYQELLTELEEAPAWNATMKKTATMIEQELLRSVASYGPADARAVSETEYRAFKDLVADKTRETARGLAAGNLWEAGDNERGARTEKQAWDALEQSDLAPEERLERFRAVVKFNQDIERAGTNPDALRSVILDIGRERGVLNNSLTQKESALLNKLTTSALESLDAAELRQFAYASAAAMVGDTQGSNVGEKLKTIQVLNMLSNPKTAMRNLVGNTTFTALDAMTMRGGALLDMALSQVTGTRSIAMEGSVLNNESRAAVAKAIQRSLAEITLDVDMGSGNRYTGKGRRTFRADGNMMERVLSSMERNMGYLLTTTDEAYKGAARSTEGATQRLIDEGKIKTGDKNYAKNQADALAKYRTFQGDTIPSAVLQGIHDFLNIAGVGDSGKRMFQGKNLPGVGENGLTVHSFGAGDVAAPFTRVAANLWTVGLDYSPVNALKGAAEVVNVIADKVRTGNVDPAKQAKGVSDVSRGLTGTGLAVGFMLLASAGAIRRADDDGDEDVAAMNRSEGMTGTQINLDAMNRMMNGEGGEWQQGDTLVDLSSVEPINYVVDMGLELFKLQSEGNGILSTFGKATANSAAHAAEDLPVMQGVSELAKDTLVYHKNPLLAVLERAGKTAVSSATPNVVAAAAKGLDDKQRSTYSSDKDGLGKVGDVLLDTLKSRVPGLRQTLPTTTGPDGEEKDNPGGVAERLINAVLNPLGVNTYTQSEVSREMERVRGETVEANFYPSNQIPKALQYTKDGKTHKAKLDYEQRQEFQKTRSTTQLVAISEMVGSSHYKSADADTQASLLKCCYDYAYNRAKAGVLGDEAAPAWVGHAQQSKRDLGISTADYLYYYETLGSEIMSGSGYEKTKRMVKAGVSLEEWAKMKPNIDADGSGSTTKTELTTYIEAHFPKGKWKQIFDAYNGNGKWKNPY